MTRLVGALVVVAMSTALLQAADTPDRVSPADFAIVAWRVNADPVALREVYECGFNVAGFVTPGDLDAVAAAGLQGVISYMIKLRSVGVFHHPDVPAGCRALADSAYVSELSGPGRFVVGEFEGPDGTPYVMVVNKDLQRSTPFGLRFRQAGNILQTNSYTGKTSEWAGENNWLAAGQGMSLSLQR